MSGHTHFSLISWPASGMQHVDLTLRERKVSHTETAVNAATYQGRLNRCLTAYSAQEFNKQ